MSENQKATEKETTEKATEETPTHPHRFVHPPGLSDLKMGWGISKTILKWGYPILDPP